MEPRTEAGNYTTSSTSFADIDGTNVAFTFVDETVTRDTPTVTPGPTLTDLVELRAYVVRSRSHPATFKAGLLSRIDALQSRAAPDSLGEAWRTAEEALPEGWRIWSLDHDLVLPEWRALAGQTVDEGGSPILGIGTGPTPTAALTALAAKLRKPEGAE